MGTLFVDKLDPQSGTSLELGSSGDTITIPSATGVTLVRVNVVADPSPVIVWVDMDLN